ncbi:uncharacterized protein DS421_3g95610 [Arachis hypogaea]|nr:uncharacterized protein DS421_3g95610 [Arachis hypogaea]
MRVGIIWLANRAQSTKRTRTLASKSVQNNGNVNEEGDGDEYEEWHDGGVGVGAAAGECSKLDLDNVDECKHKEGASNNRAGAGDEHASAESGAVDASGDELNGGGVVDGEVVVVVTGKADGLLEGEGDEAGEEEGAERVDVEGDDILGDGGGGRAGWIGVEVVRGVVGVPREADEDGEGEEGVHVHDGVQCCNVEPRERRR